MRREDESSDRPRGFAVHAGAGRFTALSGLISVPLGFERRGPDCLFARTGSGEAEDALPPRGGCRRRVVTVRRCRAGLDGKAHVEGTHGSPPKRSAPRKGSDGWRLPRSRAGCEAAFVGVGGRRALARAPGFFLEAADLLVGRGRAGGGGVAGVWVRVVVAWASGRAGARPLRGGCWWGCRGAGVFFEAADLLVGRVRGGWRWRGGGLGSCRGRAGVRPSGSSAASRRVVVWLGRGVLRSGRPPGRPGAWRVAVAWRGFGFVSWSRGRPAERELGRFEEGGGGGVVGCEEGRV
jgi:hypothetical protein